MRHWIASSLCLTLATAGVAQQWTTGGPYGGWIERVVVDPSGGAAVFAVSGTGRLFRSADGGLTWTVDVAAPPKVQTAVFGSPSGVLFVGTSDGVFRRLPGDSQWVPWSQGLRERDVSALGADIPQARLYCMTFSGGVYSRGLSDGAWAEVGSGPSEATDLLVTTGGLLAWQGGGLFRSSDSGRTWAQLLAASVRSVAVDPARPERILAGTWPAGLLESTDSGTSWQQLGSASLPAGTPRAIVFDRESPSRVVLATVVAADFSAPHLWSSEDGGASWSPIDAPLSAFVEGLAVDPAAPRTLFAALAGQGVAKSIDAGRTWQLVSNGMRETYVGGLVPDPAKRGTVYAAMNGAGLFKSRNFGKTWTFAGKGAGAELNAAAYAVGNPASLFVSGFGGIWRSQDGAATWQKVGPAAVPWIRFASLVVSPSDPRRIYAGTDGDGAAIYLSEDGGDTWKAVAAPFDKAYPLAIGGSTVDTIYVSRPLGRLWKSTDAGRSWQDVAAWVSDVVLSTETADTVYVAAVGNVFKTVDGGQSWRLLSDLGQFPKVNTLNLDPRQPSRLFAAGGAGVFRTDDGGERWFPVGNNPGELREVAVDPLDARVLYTGAADGNERTPAGGAYWLRQPILAAPTRFEALRLPQRRVELRWRDNSAGEDSFRIEMRKGNVGPFAEFQSVGANTDRATTQALSRGTTYEFRVRARKGAVVSAYSDVVSIVPAN